MLLRKSMRLDYVLPSWRNIERSLSNLINKIWLLYHVLRYKTKDRWMHVCCGGGSDALAALAIGVCAVTCLTDLGSIRLLLWHTSLSSLCLRDRIRRYLTDVISLPINFSCNYRLFITHDLKLLVFVSLYAKTINFSWYFRGSTHSFALSIDDVQVWNLKTSFFNDLECLLLIGQTPVTKNISPQEIRVATFLVIAYYPHYVF
jgi:hypothetical protein